MKLPNLDDLELEMNSPINEIEEVKKKPEVKKPTKKTETKKVDKKTDDKIKKEPIIPKTQYDAEGNPMLAIPDLDDVDLSSEIDRFFGKGGD